MVETSSFYTHRNKCRMAANCSETSEVRPRFRFRLLAHLRGAARDFFLADFTSRNQCIEAA